MNKVFAFLSYLLLLSLSCNTNTGEIAIINSYHKGYDPSDKALKALTDSLTAKKLIFRYFELDSKRLYGDSASMRADVVLDSLQKIRLKLLIAMDDHAVKNIVTPFYSGTQIPVVFCGVNWSATDYNLRANVTGVLEVLPLKEALNFFKRYYPEAINLAILSENSLSEQNNTRLLDTLYKNAGFNPSYMYAEDFNQWKVLFTGANKNSDIVYLPTNGAIKGWNTTEAIEHIKKYISVPVFTCDDFMMPYCVAGFTKVASEQGELAAETAIAILKGTKPSDLPLTFNKKSRTWFNPDLAGKIGFDPGSDWINKASVYNSK